MHVKFAITRSLPVGVVSTFKEWDASSDVILVTRSLRCSELRVSSPIAHVVFQAKPVLKESRRLSWCRETWIIETGGVMDKCVQKFDKELCRLGQDGSGYGRKRKALPWIERTGEESPGWNELEESPGWRKLEESAKERDLVRDWSEKEGKTMNAGGVEE
ncbi:hypothetical protein TNCV_3632591 [Trichonephila clavipes]|nr:hypothetical protein TNCV_3632591 [Trichonephila clavipes]